MYLKKGEILFYWMFLFDKFDDISYLVYLY